MILLMFYIINQDICLMNAKIDLFCFKIYFSPLILWTRNQLEIPNFQLDCADKRIGLTNNLRNIGAMYEFLYNSDEAQNCIDNFFLARFACNSIIYLPIAALTRYFFYTYS